LKPSLSAPLAPIKELLPELGAKACGLGAEVSTVAIRFF